MERKIAQLLTLTLAGLTMLCSAKVNQKIPNREARIREYGERVLSAKQTPGLQYVVVDGHGPLFQLALGFADISGNQPMRADTTQMAYSMTKTFTAVAVLQLAGQGKIDLEAPVQHYLPEIPYGSKVKVRHLLAQTSGIPDPMPLKWVHLAEEHSGFSEITALKRVLSENADLQFTPGHKYAYSNISYWLLGKIIEKASGQRYEQYLASKVFAPLRISKIQAGFSIPESGLQAKGYLREWSMPDLLKGFLIDKKFVGGYEDGWLNIRGHYLNGAAFGGLVASAGAVSIFLTDQLKPHSAILGPNERELFYRQQLSNDSKPVPMTLGWHIGQLEDEQATRFYFKEGGGAGFHCEMRIYPAAKIGTVVMANSLAFGVKSFLNQADAEFLYR